MCEDNRRIACRTAIEIVSGLNVASLFHEQPIKLKTHKFSDDSQ